MTACAPGDTENNLSAADADQNKTQLPLPPAPVVPTAMDREAILIAVNRAATAFALGTDDADDQRELDGQQFEFRMRFGCQSGVPEKTESPFSVDFDDETRTLRISASPQIVESDPAIAAISGEQVEAVEGFWINRPWLLAAGCPRIETAPVEEDEGEGNKTSSARRPEAPDTQPAPQSRVGIARFFGPDESRTGRRDSRAYQVTKILPERTAPSASGYDIVFAGRLRKMADGRVIACSSVGETARPSCVVSATFDRVSIRRGDTDELLAEWGSG